MKIAVVGCGSIGSRYVHWLSELGAEVIACDSDSERLKQFKRLERVASVKTLEAALSLKPDRMLVATPPNTHADVACAGLEVGVDVLIEKPIASTVKDAARIVDTAKRSQCQAWVVCNMRFHDGPQMLKKHMDKIGTPLFARVHFGHRLSQMRPAGTNVFASSSDEGGGVILDCIHEIDYLQWLFGEIDMVDSWIGQIGPDKINAEDFAEIRLQFKNGVRVTAHFDFLMRRKRRGAEIIGSEGNLIWYSEGKNPEDCSVTFGDNNSELILLHNPKIDSFAGYIRMLHDFLRDGENLQTVKEGMRALSVAIRAKG
jgi:predicted dehydrogenase